MSKSELKEFVDFIPAQLTEGKEWFVYFYVKNPATEELVRKRIKCNRINSLNERRKFARSLIVNINTKLKRGWNPFISDENSKGFYQIIPALEIFLSYMKRALVSGELRNDTFRSYNSYVKLLTEWLIKNGYDSLFIINFNKQKAKEYLNDIYLEKNISGRTYNNYIANYKRIFNWLKEFDYCKVNPFDDISKKPQGHKQRIQYIDKDVREKIKNHLEKKNYNFMICCLLAYHALIRPKEITYLKVKDIDLIKQQIHISGTFSKNRRDRHPTIPNVMVKAIKKMKLDGYGSNLYLFSHEMKPGLYRLDTRRIAKFWDKLRTELKLEKEYKFYSLRDSGIIQKLIDGIPPNEVMHQADHESLNTTNKYVKIANPEIFTNVRDKSSMF